MTASVFDKYLAEEGREPQRNGCHRYLTADEVAGVRVRAMYARNLPFGLRGEALKSIGRDYGIGLRSVQRYSKSRTYQVNVGGYLAMFTVSDSGPRQSSPWERT